MQAATPSKEAIEELIKRGLALGAPQVKSDGTLTFDYFVQTMKLTIEYTIKHTYTAIEDLTKQRRNAIKDNNMAEYKEMVYKASNFE